MQINKKTHDREFGRVSRQDWRLKILDDYIANFDAGGLTAANKALTILRDAQTREALQAASDHAIAVARRISDSIVRVVGGEWWIESSIPTAFDGTPHMPGSYCVGLRPDLLGTGAALCVHYEINDDPVPAEVAWAPDTLSDIRPRRNKQLSTAFVHGAESILRDVCDGEVLTEIATALRGKGVHYER